MAEGPSPLLTFGHGTAGPDEIVALLRDAGVGLVVDVRSYPGSRRHPHVTRSELERWLPDAGIRYRWEPRLGGRRDLNPDSPHVGIRNASLRAYADHMETAEFAAALDDLLADVSEVRTAIMCAESLWTRCHRRFVADAVTLLRNVSVEHLHHEGRREAHVPTDPVRVSDDGRLLYDGGEPTGTLWQE
jgi:uncharacterized protein (DUF488 family)